jgi:hypothetical protein
MKKLVVAVGLVISLLACKKESAPPDSNPLNNTGNKKGNVYLVKAKLLRTENHTGALVHSEYALAYAIDSFNQYVDMGVVNYADSTLIPYPISNATPTYYFNVNNPNVGSGFTTYLNGAKTWSVSGNTALGIPAISATASDVFPSVVNTPFQSGIIINRNAAYTTSWDNSLPADSIEVKVGSGATVVSSGMIKGNINSYTFTPNQLQALQPQSTVVFQIVAFVQQESTVSNVRVILKNIVNVHTLVDIR